MAKRNCDLTDYKNLYSNVYWGNFKARPDIADIIKNRNEFASTFFGEKLSAKKAPSYVSKEAGCESCFLKKHDHHEYYYLKKAQSYVVVISPYDPDQDFPGWEEIFKLYADNARTFMKVIPAKTKGKTG